MEKIRLFWRVKHRYKCGKLDEKWGKIKIFRGGDYIRYSYI